MSAGDGSGLSALMAVTAARLDAKSIGVAVSGGSDSTALLLLLAGLARQVGLRVVAATVDHGLRAASADEAGQVADLCARLGVEHAILTWTGWDQQGNLQDAARKARYDLLGQWARARGCDQVWLGHTADDQAETFLMRLARGSGVDGLAAMPEHSERDGLQWVRPLLGVSRAVLREYLHAQGQGWIDDPSNADPRFERIRFRNAAGTLAELGLGQARLNATAANMERARQALERMTDRLAEAAARVSRAGEVVLDRAIWSAADDEIRLRLLARSLNWVSGAVYRPRLEALVHLEAQLRAGDAAGMSLHGCLARAGDGTITIRREPARVEPMVDAAARVWDGRWRVEGEAAGLMLGALGEAGLAQAEGWRETGENREALLTTPALWRGENLVAAPLAGLEAGFTASFSRAFAGGKPARQI